MTTMKQTKGSNIRALMSPVAGPGHLHRSAPYPRPSGQEMYDREIGRYEAIRDRLDGTYHEGFTQASTEWALLRNPIGQNLPGFWTPAFSRDDALHPSRKWLRKLIQYHKERGRKVVLFGNQPHRWNRGTMAQPDIMELTIWNRDFFGLRLANDLATIAEHLGADAIGFDSFPKPTRTVDGVFGRTSWTLGPVEGVEYLQDLVGRLNNRGIAVWAENEPPAGTMASDWPDNMHFAKLTGNVPRGQDDDDPDRLDTDPRDRRTPEEVTELFKARGVPPERGWLWIQAGHFDGPPTIDTPYGVMVPTTMRWEVNR